LKDELKKQEKELTVLIERRKQRKDKPDQDEEEEI